MEAGLMHPPLDLERLARIVDDRVLELIVLPTEKCNFRCTYCYEDFSIGRMARPVIDALKAFIQRRSPELELLMLSWFGGEPMLAQDIVLEVSKLASNCASRYPKLSYVGSMTTNGYLLTRDALDTLVSRGVVKFQITLDGFGEQHDHTRKQADGSGTFRQIWSNLLAIRDSPHEVHILLRIHFDAYSFDQLDDLVEAIKREFLGDVRFKVGIKALERLGGPNDHLLQIPTEKQRSSAMENIARQLGQDPDRGTEDYVCYAARPNSLVVRADGRIGKCTVALNDIRNTVGRITPDGMLDLDQSRVSPWLRGLKTLDPEALACPLSGISAEDRQMT